MKQKIQEVKRRKEMQRENQMRLANRVHARTQTPLQSQSNSPLKKLNHQRSQQTKIHLEDNNKKHGQGLAILKLAE